MSALAPIIARTRVEVARRRRAVPPSELERVVAERVRSAGSRPMHSALATPGLSVIAEHKRCSPSAGRIRADVGLEEVVRAYERGGAAALSVLTEGGSFGGSLEDLRAAREATALPILRKDFIVDAYQVVESAAAGADAILLIAAALSPEALLALHDVALGYGLTPLVEVHDEREIERALAFGARVIGINNRNLTTLEVDGWKCLELLPLVAGRALVVAESGFSRRAELDELERSGFDGVLVGEALMRSDEIEAACLELTR
jgi:indole-3-glycerol phosphate synthase